MWNRLYLRNRLKSSFLRPRDKSDVNTPDSLFNEAIEAAMKELARECRLLPDKWSLALAANQYKYPLPQELDRIYALYYIDTDNTHKRLEYMAEDNYLSSIDPTDVQSEPLYFTYPHFGPPTFEFHAGAPTIYDYIRSSYITAGSIRTVIDSGANFGRTRSGSRIRPGCSVFNITDKSNGYVQYLDMTTAKTTGTATSDTTTDTLEDTGENFTTDSVAVGDIICTPSTGEVLAYAFVIEVGTTTLRYADIEGQDANGEKITRFKSTDTYKVGTATEIRLWSGRPVPEGTRVAHAGWNHPGLRQGTTNDFTVSSTKATITGTTFTNTTVTGSSTSGAEESDIAIASGGSHGLVSGVEDNTLTVDKWIGGLPSAAETVTVLESEQYAIEDRFATERQIWIGPPVDAADSAGNRSILMTGYRKPRMPQEDDDPIEIQERYEQPLLAACRWQMADLMGIYTPAEVLSYEKIYRQGVSRYTSDVDRQPYNQPVSPFRNRRMAVRYGRKDQTRNGLLWDV